MSETPEKVLANNFLTGIMATLTQAESIDTLICLTELRRGLNGQIDTELEKWSDELDAGDE
jgi:hypothetical protein